MKKNAVVKNNFKKRPNYKRTVSRKGYKNFPWKSDPFGLMVWIGMSLFWEDVGGNSFVDFREFSKQGLNAETAYGFMIQGWTSMVERYRNKTEHDPTPKAILCRIDHQYYGYTNGVRGSGRNEICSEHLLRHPELAPWREKMSALMIKTAAPWDKGTERIALEYAKSRKPLQKRAKSNGVSVVRNTLV